MAAMVAAAEFFREVLAAEQTHAQHKPDVPAPSDTRSTEMHLTAGVPPSKVEEPQKYPSGPFGDRIGDAAKRRSRDGTSELWGRNLGSDSHLLRLYHDASSVAGHSSPGRLEAHSSRSACRLSGEALRQNSGGGGGLAKKSRRRGTEASSRSASLMSYEAADVELVADASENEAVATLSSDVASRLSALQHGLEQALTLGKDSSDIGMGPHGAGVFGGGGLTSNTTATVTAASIAGLASKKSAMATLVSAARNNVATKASSGVGSRSEDGTRSTAGGLVSSALGAKTRSVSCAMAIDNGLWLSSRDSCAMLLTENVTSALTGGDTAVAERTLGGGGLMQVIWAAEGAPGGEVRKDDVQEKAERISLHTSEVVKADIAGGSMAVGSAEQTRSQALAKAEERAAGLEKALRGAMREIASLQKEAESRRDAAETSLRQAAADLVTLNEEGAASEEGAMGGSPWVPEEGAEQEEMAVEIAMGRPEAMESKEAVVGDVSMLVHGEGIRENKAAAGQSVDGEGVMVGTRGTPCSKDSKASSYGASAKSGDEPVQAGNEGTNEAKARAGMSDALDAEAATGWEPVMGAMTERGPVTGVMTGRESVGSIGGSLGDEETGAWGDPEGKTREVTAFEKVLGEDWMSGHSDLAELKDKDAVDGYGDMALMKAGDAQTEGGEKVSDTELEVGSGFETDDGHEQERKRAESVNNGVATSPRCVCGLAKSPSAGGLTPITPHLTAIRKRLRRVATQVGQDCLLGRYFKHLQLPAHDDVGPQPALPCQRAWYHQPQMRPSYASDGCLYAGNTAYSDYDSAYVYGNQAGTGVYASYTEMGAHYGYQQEGYSFQRQQEMEPDVEMEGWGA